MIALDFPQSLRFAVVVLALVLHSASTWAAPPERAILEACGPADEALGRAAAEVARRRLTGQRITSADELAAVLREAGSTATWPRSLVFLGQPVDLLQATMETRNFVRKLPVRFPVRCGVAVARGGQGVEAIAVVAAPNVATVVPIPKQVRPDGWVTLEVKLQVPASDARLVVLGPRGLPREIPSSFHKGKLQGRFLADRPGRWLAQAVADLDHGPMPVAEVEVFRGDAMAPMQEVPGEGAWGADNEATLLAMLNEARRSEGLPPLVRDEALTGVARAHAEAMAKQQVVGHDLGQGDPQQRAEAAGVRFRILGENVARASSVAQAHRGLWASPSHRKNTLDSRWQRAGVAVVERQGSSWVTVLFAAP
ncbi:MAG: CAP domain-containing protein [Myxococcales bacterium]|nr:CAP domain-containing protein [Polyangiaceae bacterium]MDW8250338.1 CAP domain-containing protein [Myxococcales bacterium]